MVNAHDKTMLTLVVLAPWRGLIGYHYWHAGETGQPKFRTLPVDARRSARSASRATGTVEPVEIIDVGAQIVGSIKSFGPDPDQPGKTIDYCSRVKRATCWRSSTTCRYQAERGQGPRQPEAGRGRAQPLPRPSRTGGTRPIAPRNCEDDELRGRIRKRRWPSWKSPRPNWRWPRPAWSRRRLPRSRPRSIWATPRSSRRSTAW